MMRDSEDFFLVRVWIARSWFIPLTSKEKERGWAGVDVGETRHNSAGTYARVIDVTRLRLYMLLSDMGVLLFQFFACTRRKGHG